MKRSTLFLLLIIAFAFFGLIYAFMSHFAPGTHGSVVAYQFPVSKNILHHAVNKVILSNKNIYNDVTPTYTIDVTDGRNDTTFSNYYNDGNRYYTIDIKAGEESIRYTFQFPGTEENWDTSKTSSISIAYAYDNFSHEGGSDGNGIEWYTPGLKKRIMKLFEREFINKLDKELQVTHTTSD